MLARSIVRLVSSSISALWRLVATATPEGSVGVDPEIEQRLSALRPALAAQVAADRNGEPKRNASRLIENDENLFANAAKHTLGLDFDFRELQPAEARRRQRGGRRGSGRSPMNSVDGDRT